MNVHRTATHDNTTLALCDHIRAMLDAETTMDHPDQPHGTASCRVLNDDETGEVVLKVNGRIFHLELWEKL